MVIKSHLGPTRKARNTKVVHKKNHELGCQPEEHHCPEYVPHNTETETYPSILLVTTVYNLSAFWGLILSGTQLHDPIKLRTNPMAVLAFKKWTLWQKAGGIPRVSTSVENEQADAGRGSRTGPVGQHSQARTGKGKYRLSLVSLPQRRSTTLPGLPILSSKSDDHKHILYPPVIS